MGDLVSLQVGVQMTSLEISELTGKTHSNVLKDIDKMLNKLDIQSSDFSLDYKDSRGRDQRMYKLDKRRVQILIMGYEPKLCDKILDHIDMLEGKAQRPLTQLEIISQSAQILLEQDKRVTQLENKVLQIEAQQKTINTDYYTIAGYCHIKGKSIPITEASLLGRKCSKLSKELEYDIFTTYDARYGTVNLYHIDILSQIIQ